jgi:outer membrane protein W
MRPAKILALLAIAALAITLADATDAKQSIGVFVSYVSPTGDYENVSFNLEADSAVGYGVAYRYAFHPRWDLAVSLSYADHDVNAWNEETPKTKIGAISWMPLLFDGNWHFGKEGMLYVGPTLGYAMWDDLEEEGGPGRAKMKDGFVYGVNFGIDVPFAKAWAFNAHVRYLLADAETDEEDGNFTLGVDPWIVGVGVAYRF